MHISVELVGAPISFVFVTVITVTFLFVAIGDWAFVFQGNLLWYVYE